MNENVCLHSMVTHMSNYQLLSQPQARIVSKGPTEQTVMFTSKSKVIIWVYLQCWESIVLLFNSFLLMCIVDFNISYLESWAEVFCHTQSAISLVGNLRHFLSFRSHIHQYHFLLMHFWCCKAEVEAALEGISRAAQ